MSMCVVTNTEMESPKGWKASGEGGVFAKLRESTARGLTALCIFARAIHFFSKSGNFLLVAKLLMKYLYR